MVSKREDLHRRMEELDPDDFAGFSELVEEQRKLFSNSGPGHNNKKWRVDPDSYDHLDVSYADHHYIVENRGETVRLRDGIQAKKQGEVIRLMLEEDISVYPAARKVYHGNTTSPETRELFTPFLDEDEFIPGYLEKDFERLSEEFL